MSWEYVRPADADIERMAHELLSPEFAAAGVDAEFSMIVSCDDIGRIEARACAIERAEATAKLEARRRVLS